MEKRLPLTACSGITRPTRAIWSRLRSSCAAGWRHDTDRGGRSAQSSTMARSMAPQSFAWQGTGLTDIGLVRPSNQDAFAVLNDVGLWIVADGMGGHAGG